MTPADQVVKLIAQNGWLDMGTEQEIDLLSLAKQFGEPIPATPGGELLDQLVLRKSNPRNPGYWSNRFGLGAFPFHTDCAYYRKPPKYLLLKLSPDSNTVRPSFLLDTWNTNLSVDDYKILRRESWKVENSFGRFLTPIINTKFAPEQIIFRFDPTCMRPYLSSAKQSQLILERLCCETQHTRINWSPGQVVIVDNWRMLHQRGNGPLEEHRILQRVLVA